MSSGRSRKEGTGRGKTCNRTNRSLLELAVFDHLLQVAVGGRDHAHIDLLSARAAQPFKLMLL